MQHKHKRIIKDTQIQCMIRRRRESERKPHNIYVYTYIFIYIYILPCSLVEDVKCLKKAPAKQHKHNRKKAPAKEREGGVELEITLVMFLICNKHKEREGEKTMKHTEGSQGMEPWRRTGAKEV